MVEKPQKNNRKLARRRSFIKGIAGTAGVVSIAGCTGENGGQEGAQEAGSQEADTLVINHQTGPAQLDPHNHSLPEMTDALRCVYDELLFMDQRHDPPEFRPRLATDWEYVDERTFRLEIREGVEWHNGDELTVDDVAFSMRRAAFSDVGGSMHDQDSWTMIEEVDTDESDNSVIYHLNEDFVLLAQELSTHEIVNREWIESNEQEYIAEHTMGTGPYELEDFTPGIEAVFTSFDNYWDGDVAFDRIIFRGADEASTRANQVITGESDVGIGINPEDFDRVESEDGARIVNFTTDRNEFVGMNMTVEPFDDKRVRQALNYAVDKEAIVEFVMGGRGTVQSQPAPPFWEGHNPDIEPYPFDPDMAAELLDEAGVSDMDYEFDLPTRSGILPRDLEIAQVVANMVNENAPGITLNVQEVDSATFTETRTADSIEDRYDIYVNDTGGSPPFAGAGKIDSHIVTAGHSSLSTIEEIDEMYREGLTIVDDEERNQYAMELMEMIHEEAPWIFLFFRDEGVALSDRVDLEPTPNEDIIPYDIERL